MGFNDVAVVGWGSRRVVSAHLTIGPTELIDAARILGAKVVVPIHNAHDQKYRFLPKAVFRRTGSAEDAANLGALTANSSIRIHRLPTGHKSSPFSRIDLQSILLINPMSIESPTTNDQRQLPGMKSFGSPAEAFPV
jgi:hypothetical protein